MNVSPEGQLTIDTLRAEIRALREGFSYQDTCFLTKESQSVVNHGIGALSELGKGNPSIGIDDVRDQHKRVKKGFSLWDMVTSRVLVTVIIAVVIAIMGWVAIGFRG